MLRGRFRLQGAALLALTALLPAAPRALCALTAIILLGVPHGALDMEIARSALRATLGRIWPILFSIPYLFLSALVLFCWRWAPVPTLAAFLAASVWHFGSEDSRPGTLLEPLALGGLPIAVAVLAQPAATATLFGTVAAVPMTRSPDWLTASALVWLVPALLWLVDRLRSRELATLRVPLLLVAAFTLLPPLTAFAIYFVFRHAPAHVAALFRNPIRAPRIRDVRSVIRYSLPTTALTLVLGGLLWRFYQGPVDQRLLCLTIQALAALTLPHMLFDLWLTHREGRGQAPLAAATKLRINAGSFSPRMRSTPDETSTAGAPLAATASATLSGVSPPASSQGTGACQARMIDQSNATPLPPGRAEPGSCRDSITNPSSPELAGSSAEVATPTACQTGRPNRSRIRLATAAPA